MMIKFADIKIRTKIAMVFSALIAFVILSVYLYFPQQLKKQTYYEVGTISESFGKMCAFNVSPALYFRDIIGAQEALKGARQNEDLVYLIIHDKKGKIFATYNFVYAERIKYRKDNGKINEAAGLYKFHSPVFLGKEKVGEIYLGISINRIQNSISQSKTHIKIASGIFLLLGMIGTLLLSTVITKPFKKIVSTFNQISKGDLSRRVDFINNSEVGQMSKSFNSMVDNLEEVYKELEKVNLELENRVEERTNQLQQEVDEHTKTIEKLYKSETKSRALLYTIPDTMFVIDREGVFLEFKSDPGKHFKADENIIGQNLKSILPQETAEEAIHLVEKTLSTGKSQILEYTIPFDGELRSYEARFVASWDDEVLAIVRDITEMKKSFNALRESEAKFRVLAETLPVAIFIHSKEKIIYANPGMEQLTGYSQSELYNIKLIEVVEENFKTSFQEAYNSNKMGDKAFRSEIQIHTKNNKIKWIDFTTRVIEYDGKIVSLGSALDITNRKLAEEQLRKLSRAVQQSSISIMITNKQGCIEYVNPAFTRITGFSESEAIGQNLKSGIISKDEHRVLLEAINTGKDCKGELLGKKKTGELYWESASVSSIKNKSGEITHFLTMKEDITEQKLVEEKLIQSERDYRGLFENAHDAIIIFNPKTKVLLDANAEACRMYGYERSVFIGMNLTEFSTERIQESSLIEQILDKNIIKNYEATHIRKNGEQIYIEINATIINYKSEKAILAILRDISDRKLYERALLMAKEEAEKSNRLKSDFLAQMSHEIRTPINTILNFSSLLKEELESKVPDDLKQAFLIIDNGGRRLIRTIDLILNMSQVQTGSYEIKLNDVDLLKDVLDNLKLEFNNIAKSKGLSLEIINNAQNTFLNVDIYTVGQIFSNLIDNAIKFTHNGKIEVRLYNNDCGELCVDVVDTGIGISEEYQRKLFTPFSQEETGYTRSFEGNGLGLALVKKYADLNNAEIQVISEKEKGSRFSLTFKENIRLANSIAS